MVIKITNPNGSGDRYKVYKFDIARMLQKDGEEPSISDRLESFGSRHDNVLDIYVMQEPRAELLATSLSVMLQIEQRQSWRRGVIDYRGGNVIMPDYPDVTKQGIVVVSGSYDPRTMDMIARHIGQKGAKELFYLAATDPTGHPVLQYEILKLDKLDGKLSDQT